MVAGWGRGFLIGGWGMRPLALGPITITGRSEFAHWVVCGQGVCGKKGFSHRDQMATAALQVLA